jgi:hypothetical protein
MADLNIFEKYPGSWRIDHPDFGDVCKTTFAKGIITAFYAANGDNPLVVKDVCDLTIDGQEFKEVPIFYHSPKDYIENWKQNALQTDHWKASGSLVDADGKVIPSVPADGLPFEGNSIARGAYSFAVDDEVAVLMQEGEPILVLGLVTKPPRKPLDYVKLEGSGYTLVSDMPEIFTTPETPYTFPISNPGVGGVIPPSILFGPDGKALILDKIAKELPSKNQLTTITGDPAFDYSFDYRCFYEPTVMGNRIELTGSHWDPPASPTFGPHYGNMYFSMPQYSPWADYLALWLNVCDTQQVFGAPFVGLWPNNLGRPLFWAFYILDAQAPTATSEYVLKNWLLEIGPKLYIIRAMYHKTRNKGVVKYHLWKNRIVWDWTGFVPPDDWSGYPSGDKSGWTAPMWTGSPAGWPDKIADCVPPPDDVIDASYDTIIWDQSFPYFVYSAPSSKEILDNIDSLVEASNAGIDLIALSGSGTDTVKPPEGFKEETPCEANNWVAGVTLEIPSGMYSFDYSKLKFMLSDPVH